jgi:superfamily I DNA/RNA helicase
VLVARISHLVADRGVRPERILALTFSRRAADEMSEKVRTRVPDAALVETRTFHSFALSVVRRHPAPLGLSMPPEIMATGEQWALVSELLAEESDEEWGLSPGALARPATVREVYDLLPRCQEHLLEPGRMRTLGEKTRRPYLVRAAALLERYRSRLGDLAEADYEGSSSTP